MFLQDWEGIQWMLGLGLEPKELTLSQITFRTIIIFLGAVVTIRLGNKRFFGKLSAFDVVVAIILGSVLGRGINGSAPFFESLLAGTVLMGMHWFFSMLSFHFSWFSKLVKGSADVLIRDGHIEWDAMKRGRVSEGDLLEGLRIQGKAADPSEVKIAHLERDGEISVILRNREREQ